MFSFKIMSSSYITTMGHRTLALTMAKDCISISKCLKLFREFYTIICPTNIDLIFSVVAKDEAGKKMKTEPQLGHPAVLHHFKWEGPLMKTGQDKEHPAETGDLIS